MMVLLSFSITDHIQKIKAGLKFQTSRIPRKLRSNGKPAYSVGEKAQLYYRSRMKPTCTNCLIVQPCGFKQKCAFGIEHKEDMNICCTSHTNFFGESEIIDIIHYHSGDYKERYHEVWMGYTLAFADSQNKSLWAHADGFPSWNDANEYFKASTKNELWDYKDLDVIVWDSKPIIARLQMSR